MDGLRLDFPSEGPLRQLFRPLSEEEASLFVARLRSKSGGLKEDQEGVLTLLLASKLTLCVEDVRLGSKSEVAEGIAEVFAAQSEVYAFNAQMPGFETLLSSSPEVWQKHLRELWFASRDDWVLVDPEVQKAAIIWHWGALMTGDIDPLNARCPEFL